MSLEIAKRIYPLIQSNSLTEIKQLLRPYSLEERRFIMSTVVRGSCLLYHAVRHNAVSVLIYFLDECGADPNSFGIRNYTTESCLSQAASLDDDTRMVKILLRRGADINAVSSANKTPMSEACYNVNKEIVKCLVEKGASISIRNHTGNAALISSLEDFELFKYLVEKGANINLVAEEGYTVLMRALTERQKKCVSFLLTCEDIDVRIMNDSEEDALILAMRYSTDNIVKNIIKRGDYTKEEMLRAYKLESCLSYIYRRQDKSYSLWQKVLRMQGLSKDTVIFNDQLPNPEFDNHVTLFREDDRQALLYLTSLCGPRHVLTLRAKVVALHFVHIHQNFIEIFEQICEIMQSLNSSEFLQIKIYSVLKKYARYFSDERESIQNVFQMMAKYISEFNTKDTQPMTGLTKSLYDVRLREFSHDFIELLTLLEKNYPHSIDVIKKEIKNFIQMYLQNSTGRTLINICLERGRMNIFRTLLSLGYDVNQENSEGETILHYLLDSNIFNKRNLIKLVCEGGFNFSKVRTTKYCLPCRMKKEGLFYYPEECNTLQCLAANAICEHLVLTGSELPPILMSVIQKHLHII